MSARPHTVVAVGVIIEDGTKLDSFDEDEVEYFYSDEESPFEYCSVGDYRGGPTGTFVYLSDTAIVTGAINWTRDMELEGGYFNEVSESEPDQDLIDRLKEVTGQEPKRYLVLSME